MGRVADVCNAIVTQLNAGPLTGLVTATRVNVWLDQLESGTDLKCVVLPSDLSTVPAGRDVTQRRLTVHVVLTKRLSNVNEAARIAEQDAVIDLAETVEDDLYGVPQAGMRFVNFNESVGSRIVIDGEDAHTKGIVRTVIQCTYLGD